MKVWCIDPQSGGTKIPPDNYHLILAQAAAHEEKQAWYPEFKLKLRFKGQFCYLDAFEEGEEPFPIGRLRYFHDNKWTLAFYTYSNERYEPCIYPSGQWEGTIEEALRVCEPFII